MLLLSLSVGTRNVAAASLTVNPSRGFGNFITTVSGSAFTPSSTVNVTLNGVRVLTDVSTGDGSFAAPLVVPVTQPGVYTVAAVNGSTVLASTTLTVVDTSPLRVELDVGSIHFRGENAEFYALATFNGSRVDVGIASAILYLPNGSAKVVTANVTSVVTGLYKIPYVIPVNATEGLYVLIVDAVYSTSLIESRGSSLKGFLLSASLTQWNAWLTSIQADVATVKTDVGIIKVNITTINTKITSIEGSIATLLTDVGTVKTDIATIKPTVTRIEGDVGFVKANVTDVRARLMSVEGAMVNISTSVGVINGTITEVKDGMVTIRTDVGTLKAEVNAMEIDVDSIDTNVGKIKADMSTVKVAVEKIEPLTAIITPVWVILILSLIAAACAVISTFIALIRGPEAKKSRREEPSPPKPTAEAAAAAAAAAT